MKLTPRTWIVLAIVLVVIGGLTALGLVLWTGDDSEGDTATVVEGFRVLNVTDVHETEYKLEPRTIRIERFAYYGLRAVNDGKVSHAFRITGPGLDRRTANIEPGDSRTIAVFLNHAGRYELSCPLDGHKAKGMKATIIVH